MAKLRRTRKPDFIGLGAQKAGTSWIYACLAEHPQLCLPLKEIHFFSRERNWSKGYSWYEELFSNCPVESTCGEFSTSYLSDSESPKRIAERYPQVRLIACLRNPVERAFSNFLNDKRAGSIPKEMPFSEALGLHSEYLSQGLYHVQLANYFKFFERRQILVLIYEDCLSDPAKFMRSIYDFLEVDNSFTPSMLFKRVNSSGVPRSVWLEQRLEQTSRLLQTRAFQPLWWFAKRNTLMQWLRNRNRAVTLDNEELSNTEKATLYKEFEQSITTLKAWLGRGLEAWQLKE